MSIDCNRLINWWVIRRCLRDRLSRRTVRLRRRSVPTHPPVYILERDDILEEPMNLVSEWAEMV